MLKSLIVLISLLSVSSFAEGTAMAGASQQGTTVNIGEFAAVGSDNNVTNTCGEFPGSKSDSGSGEDFSSNSASHQ